MSDTHRHLASEVHGLTLPELDRKCGTCNGAGTWMNYDAGAGYQDVTYTCSACDGSGYELTETGYALLAFLQRHPPALPVPGTDDESEG